MRNSGRTTGIQLEPIFVDHLEAITELDEHFDVSLVEKPWHTASVATVQDKVVGYITFSLQRGKPAAESHLTIQQLGVAQNCRHALGALLFALANRSLLIDHIADQSRQATQEAMLGFLEHFDEQMMRTELAVQSSLRIRHLHPDTKPKIIDCFIKLDDLLRMQFHEVGFDEIKPTQNESPKALRYEYNE